jgi:hypothetical protein
MARLIKELILSNNLLLTIFGLSGLTITLFIFQIASKKKLGVTFEKWFAVLYIFISPHVNVPPFNYLHFINITATDGSSVSQLPFVFYPWIMFVLCGRVISFFKIKFVEGLSFLVLRNPWFFAVLFATNNIHTVVPSS